METAKAARAAPNVSSGKAYRLTLSPAAAQKLSEMPATAQPAEPASGRNSVTSAATAQTTHTRYRAAIAGVPRFTSCRDAQPQENPPTMVNTGGTHAYRLACVSARPNTVTRYFVVQLLHSEYGTPLRRFAAAKAHRRRSA